MERWRCSNCSGLISQERVVGIVQKLAKCNSCHRIVTVARDERAPAARPTVMASR